MIKKGLSERLAEIGKIKIGGKGETRKSKKGTDYQLPVKFNHFVITTTEKGVDGNFIPDAPVMKRIGDKPKELSICFAFDDIDMNFFTEFQMYSGKKRICHGDGETATRTDKDGNHGQVACNTDTCKFLNSEPAQCKPTGILSCYLSDSMEVGGIYRFRTHSWNTVSAILGALKIFSNETGGVLQGLPFKLKFLKKATPDHGNVNIITIVMDGVELNEMRQLALTERGNRSKFGVNMKQLEMDALSSGYNIHTDDPADVENEFYNTTVIEVETDTRNVSDRSADILDTAIETSATVEQDVPEQASGPFKFTDSHPDDKI